jgi:protein-disulfide isomerase
MQSAVVKHFALVSMSIILFWSANQSVAQTTQKVKTTATEPKMSRAQKEAFENLIREYLLEHPSIIREAMAALQAQEEQQQSESRAENLKKFTSEIYSDADSPVVGNAKGDVSVVVFFDYFCGYCKKTMPDLSALIARDKSVKIIYKQLPILGLQSHIAALAALASRRQGKFAEFHQALLESASGSDEAVKTISDSLNLNYATLQKDMQDLKLAAAIDRNIGLAASLNINGTPAYLVGDQFIPGAIDSESLEKLVTAERAKIAKVKTFNKSAAGQK